MGLTKAHLAVALAMLGGMFWWQEYFMKAQAEKRIEQPKPFTPGITKGMVRQHAYEMFRDKLPDHSLTLEDWVLAEKDLVSTLEAEDSSS
jgi:hypothetical protein